MNKYLIFLFFVISGLCHAQAVISGNVVVGTGSSVSGPSVAFSIATATPATPAAPYLLAPTAGTVSHCYFTTLTSDAGTNFIFNVKFNGTNIISGTNATVTAGTAPGTVSTFSLTSSTIIITPGQKWELDITGGTTSWTGALQCF